MNNKPTLSIGIAAYNEAQNIGALISAFLNQKISSVRFIEIIVVSDASTDETDRIVQSFRDKNVRLVRLKERSGLSKVQNKIMETVDTDILVVSDADILPGDEYHIENLIAPILKDAEVGLTSSALIPASPKTFIEKALVRNHEWKVNLFSTFGSGDNIYNCGGPSRAFAKALYKKLRYPDNCPNDAFSYLFCMEHGLKFRYAPKARAIFRRPAILTDHIKQSVRYIAGRRVIINMFGDKAENAYKIPKGIFMRMLLGEFISHPVLFSSFVFMSIITNLKARKSKFNSRWDMAASSKIVKI